MRGWFGCVSSLEKEEIVDTASINAGREDEVEPPERALEEQVEEVRGEPWYL